jgi:hypothetical protein
MKKLTTFRDAGSLIAGLLIGLSIVVTVFVMTVPDPSGTQTVLVIVASIVFALGLVLQAVVTRPQQQGTNNADLAVWPQAKLVASSGTRSVAGARRHWSRRQIAAFILPFLKLALVRSFLAWTFVAKPRAEHGFSTSGEHLPTRADGHDHLSSMKGSALTNGAQREPRTRVQSVRPAPAPSVQ